MRHLGNTVCVCVFVSIKTCMSYLAVNSDSLIHSKMLCAVSLSIAISLVQRLQVTFNELTFPHEEVAGFAFFSSPANSSAKPQVLEL